MDKQTFRNTVSAYILKEVPRSSIYSLDNFGVRMKKGKYWIDLTLDNFYNGYRRQRPTLRDQYMAEVLAPFIKDLKRESGVSFLDVKENLNKVYPLIIGPDNTQGIVINPLFEELYIAYVLDEGMRIFFLDQPTLDKLNLPIEELDQVARGNFSRDLARPLQLFDQQRRIFGFNYGDSYDSSRLLSLLTAPAEESFSKDQTMLLMVPNRDVVLIFSAKDLAHLRQAMMIGHSSFINNPYPISKTVFQLQNGELEKFQE